MSYIIGIFIYLCIGGAVVGLSDRLDPPTKKDEDYYKTGCFFIFIWPLIVPLIIWTVIAGSTKK